MGMTGRFRMDAAADVLENLLNASGVHGATVRGGNILPTAVRFLVLVPVGTRVEQVKRLESAIALALGARSARVDRDDVFITVTVPRSDRGVVRSARLMRRYNVERLRNTATALLGIDERGDAVGVRFGDTVPHVLIGGSSGCGKSTLLLTMLYTLARLNRRRDVSFVAVDTKGDFISSALWFPHTLAVGDGADVLNWVVGQMRRRLAEGARLPRLIVAIDEMADIVSDKAALKAVETLTAMGRGAGIHVVAATQYPTAAVIGGLAKANFNVRIVGRSSDDVAARVAAGASVAANRLYHSGEFFLVRGGHSTYFVAAYTDNITLREDFGDTGGGALDMRGSASTEALAVEVAEPDIVDVWAARFLDVWRAEGRYMQLTPTLRALGEKPAGKRWDMWRDAHARARRIFFTSSQREEGADAGVDGDLGGQDGE